MNYTPELTQIIVEAYLENPCRETVDRLAVEHDKSPKSIIGKLSREGVYRRQVYTTKRGEPPITKLELVAEIAYALEFEPDEIAELAKTSKLVLHKLRERLCTSE